VINSAKPRLKTMIKSKQFIQEYWLSFVSGLLMVFAYAPFSLWWLALFLPSVVLQQINHTSARVATKKMAAFSFAWFISGISWVHVSIDQFGGLPLIVSVILMIGLCAYLALFPILASFLATIFSKDKTLNLWLLPPLWLLCEYFRSVFLTGFPWLSLGYSQIDSPLSSFAPVIGEVGLTAIILTVNICVVKIFNQVSQIIRAKASTQLALGINKRLLVPCAIIITLIAASVIFKHINWVTLVGKSTKVALIQGNVAQSMKWQPEQEWPTMLKYLDLTRLHYDADIIVWPESAIPSLEPAAQDYLATVNSSAMLNNSAIITGILNYNFETKQYFNGLIVLGKKDNNDEVGYYYNHRNRYYKHHLLPIGEFVPFQELLRPLAPLFNLPQSSFSQGNYVQPNLVANQVATLPLNCFEIAFPHQLAANFTQQTQMLLTVSNDAWFGNSHGPHQHFEIARMRALEFGRPLVRATNNGVTGVINHLGAITAIAPQFEEIVLKAEVNFVSGYTPYSQWPRLILALLIILPLALTKLLKY
jgi:apolipoprotein N-acyltransferase